MAKNAANKLNLSPRVPHLLVLLSSMLCAGRDSVRCGLIVKSATRPGEPWCKGSCSVNGKTLFQFDNKIQVTSFYKLTMEKNATKEHEDLPQSVENILEVMRNQLRSMEPEQFKTTGNHTLQVTMETQYNQGQLTDAFCNFTIDGQFSFSSNPIKNTWTGSGPGASSIMKQWEGNGELGQGLKKLLEGDFTHYYKKLWTLWREMPRSTIKTWDVTQLTFATRIVPTVSNTHPTSGNQSQSMSWVVILCIAGVIFITLIT